MALLESANVSVILNKTNGLRGDLFTIQITSIETPSTFLRRLKQMYLPESVFARALFSLYLILTSREIVVGTVDAASTFDPSLESMSPVQTVYYQRFDVDPFLTSALHGQRLSPASKPFAESYPIMCRFADQSPAEGILAISTIFSKRRSFQMMAFITAVATFVGIVCGIRFGLEAGLDIFVAVTGSTAVFQGCLFMMSRT